MSLPHPQIISAQVAMEALTAARRQARREARAYGTKFWVMKKGKVVGLKP